MATVIERFLRAMQRDIEPHKPIAGVEHLLSLFRASAARRWHPLEA